MNQGMIGKIFMLPEIVVTAIPLPLPGEAVPGPVKGRPDAELPPAQTGDSLPKPGDAPPR